MEFTFRYKDYRRDSAERQQVVTLAVDEFIRHFLLHVMPTIPRRKATKRLRHIDTIASRQPPHRRRHRPKTEIPIVINCGPRVPAWGAFVRLPAPENLHHFGRWNVHCFHSEADIGKHNIESAVAP